MNEKLFDSCEVNVPALPFPDEIAHLARVNEKVDAAVQKANDDVEQIDRDYMGAKRYMAEYRGELDPHEMFQNELALKQIDQTGAFAVKSWERLVKIKESPYFARIDFRTTECRNAEKYYIGRFAFSFEHENLIYDWRAPVAGMFYDCEVGPAGYDAPMGRIDGDLTRKRQLKVKDGVLEYVLESSVNIQDDVLQRELSHTSDEKMKSIIATIQKEQNQIIRNEMAKTMIIQGVAGSGKTSIALHRIAFLLYRFKDKLLAENVMILSPNRVFGDYISTVLPELGEEPICEFSFADIAEVQLEGVIGFEEEKDPLAVEDEGGAERIRYKSTLGFVRQLNRFLEEVPAMVFEPTAYVYGRFTVSAEWIWLRFCAYQSYPMKKRLPLIAKDIFERFDSDNLMEDEIPKPGTILKSLNRMLKVKNSLTLYKQFYGWLKRPDLLVLPKRQTLEWADVYPFLYLHAAFEGVRESRRIKHLVIDEMQDYAPVQYAVINRLFACPKTILGDFGQCINPNQRQTLEDLRRIYEDAGLVELLKSYRSTYEIISFAKGIQQVTKIQPIERHGPEPVVLSCEDEYDKLSKIKASLDIFLKNNFVTLGIILKTNDAACTLCGILAGDYEIQLISPSSTHFTNGISVTSVQMSKGLEFDEVIIPDADEAVYSTEYDRSLLYIASTRAMHRLTLFYTGEKSHLLPG